MKKLFRTATLAAFVLAMAPAVHAQNAREASVKFMKAQQSAIVADYELAASHVENALKERLEKAGLSNRSSSKGFMTFKGASWSEVSGDKVDVYAKVEGKGNKSTVTILVSKGYDNFISGSSDAGMTEKVKNFLNDFMNHVSAYQLKLDIQKQEEIVKKAEKEFTGTVSAADDLSKEREKIDKQIAQNKDDQTKKQTIVDQEKSRLEELKRQLQ